MQFFKKVQEQEKQKRRSTTQATKGGQVAPVNVRVFAPDEASVGAQPVGDGGSDFGTAPHPNSAMEAS